jgi:hypothetical protein
MGGRVNADAEFTVPEKILFSAYTLEEHGRSPFSAEDLIVKSWEKFPKTFGLKGYTDIHPDSNKVLSCIMGERGLARRGWLTKMGQKLYQLTREGRMVVQRLRQGGEAPPAAARKEVKVSREHEKILLSLLGSSAAKKFSEGLKDELTFKEACNHFGISETVHGDALASRLDRLRGMLAEVERVVGGGSADLSNGRSISKEDLDLLTAIHEYLADRFSRHLNLLRNRPQRM